VTVRAGTNTLLGLDPARISEIPERLAASSPARTAARSPEGPAEISRRPDLWDGRAAQRIVDVLADVDDDVAAGW
jgi:UDP-N-acetylglucosamine 2-epimerase (non-hydrolysing)